MSEWRIEYDNDTGPGDEGFHEWWTVTDGSRHFQCDTESDAKFLFDRLSEWKPITDESPKDGCKVLIYCPELKDPGRPGDPGTVYLAQIEVAYRYKREGWLGRVCKTWPSHPTHWMPLPAPPVTD